MVNSNYGNQGGSSGIKAINPYIFAIGKGKGAANLGDDSGLIMTKGALLTTLVVEESIKRRRN